MRTKDHVIDEKKQEAEKWASENISKETQYRVSAYPDFRKIFVEVKSATGWVNVKSFNL